MNARGGAGRVILKTLALAAVSAAAAALLAGIYIAKAFTWADVYSFFGLQTSEQPVSPSEPEEIASAPTPVLSGPLDGETAEVTFIDVGQGDCAAIRCGGMTAFIDAGDRDAAGAIRSYIGQNGITQADYLFLTHPHVDHIGSAAAILNACEVKRCVISHYGEDIAPTSATYIAVLDALEALGTPTERAGDGGVYQLGSGSLTVLSAGGYENLNDCSLVLRFDYGERSFMFMGDAGFDVESDLLSWDVKLKGDVIKIGHHGSRYSTSGAFAAAVSPLYAVISCGRDNQYGYPSDDVLRALEKQGARVFRTDIDGSVTFITDGTNFNISVTEERAA